MKYRCLVIDHDDTVVNSTATVHYPCFVQYMEKHFPGVRYTLEEYFVKNFDPGIVQFFRDEIGMTDEQRKEYAIDGVHMTAEAYRVIFGNLKPFLPL